MLSWLKEEVIMTGTKTFAKVSEVEEGTVLVADGGFTCLKDGDEREAKKGLGGDLYIDCSAGEHYLVGQLDEGGNEYVGLSLKGSGNAVV